MVLAGLRERLQPLTTRLFPRQVLLLLADRAVTVMTLARDDAPLRPDLLCSVPLPAGACVDGQPLQKMALGDLIGDLLVELGLVGAEVSAALPCAGAAWRVVQWPGGLWPDDPAETLRRLDPDLGLPYPLAQAYLRLLPLPLPQDPPASLLLAVSRQLVLGWIEVFDIAGVELLRLEAASVCDLRALTPLLAGGDPSTLTVLATPEPGENRFTLLRAGVPEYDRRLAGPPSALPEELARCVAFWRSRDPSVRSVRVLVAGTAAAALPFQAAVPPGENWRVEAVDAVEQGWIDPAGAAEAPEIPGASTPSSASLLRLQGLALADL